MKREVRICSGWPDDQKHQFKKPDMIHAAAEDWVIFFIERGEAVHCLLTSEWENAAGAARAWFDGATPADIETLFPET